MQFETSEEEKSSRSVEYNQKVILVVGNKMCGHSYRTEQTRGVRVGSPFSTKIFQRHCDTDEI